MWRAEWPQEYKLSVSDESAGCEKCDAVEEKKYSVIIYRLIEVINRNEEKGTSREINKKW